MALTPVGVEFLAKNLNSYLRDLSKADKAQLGLGKSADKSSSLFGKLGSALGGTAKLAAGVAVAGIGALAAGVGALATVSTTTAISFEDAFAGVIKTTDGLTSGIGELNEAGKELRAGFVDLTKTVPLTFEELAAIGELGGQLGIGKDALLDFTETVAALGVSTNLSTEEAATGLARISNIFNISADDMGMNIEQLGSTIVALGNNFATTERDILAFGERLAGAGKIAGLTQADVLAIGTAMSSVGVEAEAGGTAVQKVLLSINNAVAGAATGFVDYTDKIDKNVDKLTKLNAESARLEAQFPGLQAELLAQEQAFIAAGGSAEEFGRQLGDKARQKAFETAKAIQELQAETDLLRQQHGQPIDSNLLATFAATSNMTVEDFKAAWEKDASGAFLAFVEGLGAQGDDAVNTLAELGLEDQRLIRSFLSLAGAGDLLERTLRTANGAFEENTALANEAAQRYATTKSQIEIFKNTLRALADTIGTRLLPFVNDLIALGISFASDFAGPLTDALDNQVIPALENTIAFVGSWIEAFRSGATDFQAVIDMIVTSVTEAWPQIEAQLRVWGSQFVEALNSSEAQEGMNELGALLGQKLVEGLELLFSEQGVEIISNLVVALAKAVAGATAALVTIGANMLAGILEGVINGLTGGNFQADTVSTMASTWQGIWDNLKIIVENIGSDMVLGLITGFGKKVSELNQAILDLAQSIIDNFVDLFGIASPSTVFYSFGVDLIQGLIDGISSLASQAVSAVTGVFSSLFGGGEEEGPTFDTESSTASILAISEAVVNLQENFNTFLLSIQNFINVTLILLQETFTAVLTAMLEQVVLLWQTGIIPMDMALIMVYTVTLPTLQATTISVVTAMVAAFNLVLNLIRTLIAAVVALGAAFTAMGEAAGRAAEKIVDDMEDAADAIDNLIEYVDEATESFKKMAEAAREAAAAAREAGEESELRTGIGFSQGVGFMRGIGLQGGLGLGYKIPGQGRGDTFGPMFLEPGEELLVTPRGMTIDSLVMDRLAGMLKGGGDKNNTFNMTVNTLSNPQAVIQQYQVAKALIG